MIQSSPHQFAPLRTQRVMLIVILATLPGILVHAWFFGYGIMLNIIVAAGIALATEAACLKLKDAPIKDGLSDNSALVTAILFGIAMPPGSSWWLLAMGIIFAVALVKHAYGGLGQNAFNPAMAGYLFLLLAFPLQMTTWQLPTAALSPELQNSPLNAESLWQSLQFLAATSDAQVAALDGFAKATPLIEYKLAAPNAMREAQLVGLSYFSPTAETGWELTNMAYLLGGLILLSLGIVSWHIPFSILASVVVMSLLFYSPGNASVVGTPYLHLFGSATMIGAFFIATDPVSAATSNPAKIVYGIIIGVSIYSIRVWGSYLDSIAIAVLFGNFCAPLLDHVFRPRIFGHRRKLFGGASDNS